MKLLPSFLKQFTLVLVLLCPILYYVHSFDIQKNTINLSILSTIMFSVMSILLFFVLNVVVKSPNRQLFISITMLNMLIKMVMSIVVLLVYKQKFHPEGGYFVFPFIIIYLLFTIFETSFMVQIADQKP
jgi:hypothetical protein